MNVTLKHQVKQIYKELLHLSRDYPKGYAYARKRLHKAFHDNSMLTEELEIVKCIDKARYLKKEIEAMYYVKKYRHLKQVYQVKDDPSTF